MKNLKIALEIDGTALREALDAVNDEKRQAGDVNRLTLRAVKARLEDPDFSQVLAEMVLDAAIEDLA